MKSTVGGTSNNNNSSKSIASSIAQDASKSIWVVQGRKGEAVGSKSHYVSEIVAFGRRIITLIIINTTNNNLTKKNDTILN